MNGLNKVAGQYKARLERIITKTSKLKKLVSVDTVNYYDQAERNVRSLAQ